MLFCHVASIFFLGKPKSDMIYLHDVAMPTMMIRSSTWKTSSETGWAAKMSRLSFFILISLWLFFYLFFTVELLTYIFSSSLNRLPSRYPSWKLFRDVLKLSHSRLSCLAKLVVCLYSVKQQFTLEGKCHSLILFPFFFLVFMQVEKVSLLELSLKNVGAVRALAWSVLIGYVIYLHTHSHTYMMIFMNTYA